MIKFFRKIRQNLLSKGKTGKYLKYAVGETLLVVIGILIALQVNNWNQNRIAQKAEKELSQNILNDLKADKARYEGNLGEANMLQSLYKKLYQIGVEGLSYINIENPQDIRRVPSYHQLLDTDYSTISDNISNKVVRKRLLDYDLKQKRLGVYNQELRSIVVDRMRLFLSDKGMYKLDAVFDNKKLGMPFIDEAELKALSKTIAFQQLLFEAKLKLGHLQKKLQDLIKNNEKLTTFIKKI